MSRSSRAQKPLAAVLLDNPKHPQNVGGAIRAAAAFGAGEVVWTGGRVQPGRKLEGFARGERGVRYGADPTPAERLERSGLALICVELTPEAVSLAEFTHPDCAAYVFGPEDSSVSRGLRERCEAVVQIPTARCLNLAAAVNVVLYDRVVKLGAELG